MSIPSWCTWTRGTSALLLVAPHGGRRPLVDATLPPPRLRVNDVYTAEVTELLAARLGAATVINRAQDRNTLDLNRTSQVLRRAPWFLELLTEQIGVILAQHAQAEVVFLHGWNIGQPKCDVGIGAIQTGGQLHVPDGAALTVDAAYVHARIAPVRAACAAAGVAMSIGERYPASHRNNLLQLFAFRAEASDNPHAQQLAAWAKEGRLQALQLELGIPLRWPGPWRDRFLETLVAVFSCTFVDEMRPLPGPRRSPEVATGEGQRLAESGRMVPSPVSTSANGGGQEGAAAALQFYDPASDLGMFAGIGRMGPRITGGRVLLFLGGQRVALFTGEDAHAANVPPLMLTADAGGMRLKFTGPMLRLDDARVYLDLEAALAESQLIEADVDLRFTRSHAPTSEMQFGCVDGLVRIGDEIRRIGARGFANTGGLRASGARRQTMLAADFGEGGGVLSLSTPDASRSLGLHFSAAGVQALGETQLVVSVDGDVYTPRRFVLTCTPPLELRAEPQSRMAILRPTGEGRYLRVNFGVARFEWGARQGWGLYEHAEPVHAAGGSSGRV